jgi:hypothetical protein
MAESSGKLKRHGTAIFKDPIYTTFDDDKFDTSFKSFQPVSAAATSNTSGPSPEVSEAQHMVATPPPKVEFKLTVSEELLGEVRTLPRLFREATRLME